MMKRLFFLVVCISVILSILNFISASSIGLIENSTWQENLTAVRFSATVFGDIDNDGDLDLALTGCLNAGASNCDNGAISKIYLNNGTTLKENSTWQQNLTGVGYGSIAFGDIDNDGDLDLALSGCSSGTETSCNNIFSKIYINNGTSLIENLQWRSNLSGIYSGSTKLVDINNDGKLDLALTGYTGSTYIAKIYINNGTSFVESSQWQSNLTGVRYSDLAFGDVDNDGDLDMGLVGKDINNNNFVGLYLNNGTGLVYNSIWANGLTPTNLGSFIFGDIDNDGDLDLAEMGIGDYLYTYRNNGTTFIKNQSSGASEIYLAGVYEGSFAWGDYDNDGDLDLVATGYEQGRGQVYENNESQGYYFITDNIAGAGIHADDFTQNSLTLGDLDNDNDLDLIVSGISWGSGFLESNIYISNASFTISNSPPTSPSTFTSNYSNITNTLTLGWNNGSDNETSSTGLYYNLMVGNSTTNNTIVSGVYGGSSGGGNAGGGADGYFGNMMQRKNITLNIFLPAGTYYWYVQTIDTGLAKGKWSARQTITVSADTTKPIISSISSSVTTTTATIAWTTDEVSNSTVKYGTTTATSSSSVDANLIQSHSITLNSLSASTLYYYNVSSCDASGNCNTSIQYSFTTSDVPVTPPASPGGGGGGGTPTPAVNKTITVTIPKFDIDFSNVSTGSLEVKQGDIKTFSLNGEVKHSITLISVTTDSITLLITSEPITVQVKLGETKQIDINKDSINDLEIRLISIISGKANFSLIKLSGADIAGKNELGKEALFDAKVSIVNLFQVIITGREVISEIQVFNVNNIGQVDVTVNYYITSKQDNQTRLAEGSDTLAVEAVSSFVRSLKVPYNTKAGKYLFNVEVKYNDKVMASSHAEFTVIRNYEIIIAGAIIVLIVGGIFFYLWSIRRKEEKDMKILKREIRKMKRYKRWR